MKDSRIGAMECGGGVVLGSMGGISGISAQRAAWLVLVPAYSRSPCL